MRGENEIFCEFRLAMNHQILLFTCYEYEHRQKKTLKRQGALCSACSSVGYVVHVVKCLNHLRSLRSRKYLCLLNLLAALAVQLYE